MKIILQIIADLFPERNQSQIGCIMGMTPVDGIEGILLGYDTELTYKKLDDVCRLLSTALRQKALENDVLLEK